MTTTPTPTSTPADLVTRLRRAAGIAGNTQLGNLLIEAADVIAALRPPQPQPEGTLLRCPPNADAASGRR